MYCPTCQVNYTASQHQCVVRKVCATCGEEKAIQEFPIHPSSFDGHRHNCAPCVEKEKTRQKEQRRNYRILAAQQRQEGQAKREQQNALFRAYGYNWRRTEKLTNEQWRGVHALMAEEEEIDEPQWTLLSPLDRPISTQNALQEIARLQVHKPGHPSTLWADELLSLSHPLVGSAYLNLLSVR